MKSNILKFVCGVGLVCSLFSCKNSDIDFPDFEEGTTVYFPYQYPTRTINLGDDEPQIDLTNDHAHKCQIRATFGGSYNGSKGSVQVAVDETLVNNLYFDEEYTRPVKAMPSNYYQLSTTTLNFNGTMNGTTDVQLTDAFFNDPEAVNTTYVIPLVMTSQTGFARILTGTLFEGATGPRTNADDWDVKPMDFVLYCVKFQNKYSGWWVTHHTMSTENIEKAQSYEVKTVSLNSCTYAVTYQDGNEVFNANLLLTFDDSDNCTISSLTPGVTATGNGSWGDNTEKKAWGNRDRDGMELKYTVDFGNGHSWTVSEKLVWQRSGLVPINEFTPFYKK